MPGTSLKPDGSCVSVGAPIPDEKTFFVITVLRRAVSFLVNFA